MTTLRFPINLRRAHFNEACDHSFARAFTLIEMIVCLVLSAIVAATAAVSLHAAARPATMNAVSTELIAFDGASRRIARSLRQPFDLKIASDSLTPADVARRVPFHLPSGYTIDQVALSDGTDASTVHYASDGRSATYCLVVRGPVGDRHWLLFAGLSGQVIQGEGDVSGGPALVQSLAEGHS